MLSGVLETNGKGERKSERKDLLLLFESNNFRLLLSYFKHGYYFTWGSFNADKTPHMLDKFVCDESFFSLSK